CSFGSHTLTKKSAITGEYLDALAREIAGAKSLTDKRNIRCVYIGGGTPTALEAEELRRLFGILRVAYGACVEFTVEAGRPDTINKDKLAAIRDAGATRICVNAQTTNPETLNRIGRTYGAGEFERAFRLVREAGFDFVNTDIILGLPGETMADIQKTLEDVCSFEPENVTVHTLAIKNAANLTLEDSTQFADAASVAAMVDWARAYLEGKGYIPYYLYRQKYMAGNLENVGYAKPGKLCAYNIDIMEEVADNMSFGAGAMSKRIFAAEKRIERSCNVKKVKQYIERLDEMIARKFELFG
ncbi:MAG: coproporphyrinogen dehydrogenase HemZ, partial [Eubacteriales bacterium]